MIFQPVMLTTFDLRVYESSGNFPRNNCFDILFDPTLTVLFPPNFLIMKLDLSNLIHTQVALIISR